MQIWVKGIDVKRLERPKMKGPNLEGRFGERGVRL